MDIDWVPDEVLQYSIELLSSYDIRATLFMTHKTKVDLKEHEIAIHPHFASLDLASYVKRSLDDFPDAKGLRSHSLFFSEHLRAIYKQYGIEYQSNVMIYLQSRISPFWISSTTVELPIYWMDRFYLEIEQHPGFHTEQLNLNSEGLKIFCFHPIHIFLNTEKLDRYEEAKKFYKNPKKLLAYRNVKSKGTKDLFLQLLDHIKKNKLQNRVMRDVKEEYILINKR